MIDYSTVQLTKWGYVDYRKYLGRYSADDKPNSFNGIRYRFRELYLKYPKSEADTMVKKLADVYDQWANQLEVRVDDRTYPKGEAYLYDPDAQLGMPNLSDIVKLYESQYSAVCIPIRNTLEIQRLERKRSYYEIKLQELNASIEELKDETKQA